MNKWLLIILVLLGLYLVGSVFAFIAFGNDGVLGEKIEVISLDGEISTSSDNGLLQSGGVSSTDLVKIIKDVSEDDSVVGVIFEINSPGGSVVASQEIADAIKFLNKTNYAVIRESGASGAYWIASATDKIIASPMSITGSIGVYGSYLEFSGLFEKYGVNYERLISGKYKDLGVPYRNLTTDEMNLLQSKLNKIHEFFIKEVAKNRNMDINMIRNLSTGEFYLGEEAKDLGLVDVLGNRDTAIELMKQELNLTEINVVENKPKSSLIDAILGNVAFQFGRGFGSVLTSLSLQNNFQIKA